MEEKKLYLEVSDGRKVELIERWKITDVDSYSVVDVIDCETNELLGEFKGEVPDEDYGEDYDVAELIRKVEECIYD